MDNKFHIIVTSESTRARTFAVPKPILKKLTALLAFVFITSTIAGITYSSQNLYLKKKLANLQTDLGSMTRSNQDLHEQVVNLEEKNKAQLTGAYGELNQRSQVIEAILSTLDITTQAVNGKRDGKDSGGPFVGISDSTCEDLICKVDREIKTIRPLPLGYPVEAKRITSLFGRRVDPMNGETAYHDGIDLSGLPGSEVKATADGRVIERGHNDTYGWYIMLDHGNNFTTMYAHNQKIVAKWGDKVVRGQTISLLGNTGRSTGPHLHYEVRYKNRPINPIKYMNITKLLSINAG
jgi:murein DD-endopeptidase MepM/ murein hydrolase activator NlpD